jgi:hypothetical protein
MLFKKNNRVTEVASDQPRFGDEHRDLNEGPLPAGTRTGTRGDQEKAMRIDNNIPDNLSVASTEMSFGKMLKGTSVAPLTVFERKAALVNA